jgi:hypothetical protein
MKVKFTVSNKDILLGVRYSPIRCPIALAIKRKIVASLLFPVSVGVKYVSMNREKFPIPENTQKYARCFDTGKKKNPQDCFPERTFYLSRIDPKWLRKRENHVTIS